MNPDHTIDKLAKFTPLPTAVDPAELLFAAGRASARTAWGWKAGVIGLLLTNLVCVALLIFRSPESTPKPWSVPVPIPLPIAVPQTRESPLLTSGSADDRWSYRSLTSVGDPDQFPTIGSTTGPMPIETHLTLLSARSGEID